MAWKRLRRRYNFALAVALFSVATLIVSACVPTVYHVSPLPDKELQTQKLIEPGRSSRNDVRKILGEPTILNERYRIEVYRDTDVEWSVAIFPPVPYRYKQTIASYILIIYNADWVVKEFDAGLWAACSSGPAARDTEPLHISADGFGLYGANPCSSFGPAETLLAPVDLSRAVLAEPKSSTRCIVYLSPDLLVDQISLDEDILAEIAEADLGQVYFRLLMMPGEHRLKFALRDHVRAYSTQSLEHDFSCTANQALYIDVTGDFVPQESLWRRARYKIDINQYDSMPPDFNEKRLVIYHHGKWWDLPDLIQPIK